MRLWWRRLKVVVRQRCDAPASFQKRVSFAQSASVPVPIDTQTSIPTWGGIAAYFFGHSAQLAEDVERALVGRIGVRHPAIAPFGDARQGSLVIPASSIVCHLPSKF